MTIEPLQLVPDNLNAGNQIVSFADISPNMTTKKIYNAPRGINTPEELIRVGVNSISKYDVPTRQDLEAAGKTYDAASTTPQIMNLPTTGINEWVGNYPDNYNKMYFPNGLLTEAQGAQKGSEYSINHRVAVFETEENLHYTGRHNAMWRGYYSTYIPRMIQKWEQEKGMDFIVAHNYFNLGWPDIFNLGSKSVQEHKDALAWNINQFPFTQYSPGGTLSLVPGISEGIYINAPDDGRKSIYNATYRMMMFAAMGKQGIIFLFGNHEYFPNNQFKTFYPDGTFYKSEKIPLDPNEIMGYAAIGQIFGKSSIQWGNSGKTANKDFSPDWPQGDKFFANGSNTPSQFTHYTAPGQPSLYNGYNGAADFFHFGVRAANKTFGEQSSNTGQFINYTIDGAGKSGHVVDAAANNTGIFYIISDQGKASYFYINPMADNNSHGVTFNINGNPYTMEVSGNAPHMGTIIL